MKTDRYYIENIYAPVISFLLGAYNLFSPEVIACKDPIFIISKSIDISFIIFGFLLTVLALIIQSNAEFKKRALYPRLITYNKRIVFLALSLGLYSLIYATLFVKIHQSDEKEFFVSLFVLLFTWVILDLVHFIKIFYSLAVGGKI